MFFVFRKSILIHSHKTQKKMRIYSQCDSSGTASSSPVACIQKDPTKSTLKQDDENNSAETVHTLSTPESLSSQQSGIAVSPNEKPYRYRTKAKADHAKYEFIFLLHLFGFCVIRHTLRTAFMLLLLRRSQDSSTNRSKNIHFAESRAIFCRRRWRTRSMGMPTLPNPCWRPCGITNRPRDRIQMLAKAQTRISCCTFKKKKKIVSPLEAWA